MIPKEILDFYCGAVIAACGIAKERLFSKSRDEDVVDARHILINLLYDAGAYPSIIASALGVTARCVTYAISGFNNRLRSTRWMRINYEKTKKELGND